jgi:alkaline phosphatase D
MLEWTKLDEAVRYEGGVSRRLFLAYTASLSAIPLLGRQARGAQRKLIFGSDPFRVGVASGDPASDSVVLWTRLAPKPLEPGGGMPTEDVEVQWEIASDDAMRKVVRRGTTVASQKLAHSVHVEAGNLEPGRWYWYRFRAGDAESPIGRTRTMPAADSTPDMLRFAFASCQHYETGLYTAYDHMAKEDVDLVFHLGDYIYEGAAHKNAVRKHHGAEIFTVDDYRIRHAQYKSDPLLQTMHARCPWVVTWDDHEVDNNYAGDSSENLKTTPAEFLKRRAGAYQAYYEMMPLRSTSLPSGPNMQLYRNVSFGRLAAFNVLDTRQHRSDQPGNKEMMDLEALSRHRKATILGKAQLGWLQQSLAESPAMWSVLAQQVLMATLDYEKGKKEGYYSDGWPAYIFEKQRLMQFMADRKINNLVVITGDFHANIVSDLRVDDRKAEMPIVGTEFIGTSISSAGDGEDQRDTRDSLLAENPCLKFVNDQRGYPLCTVTPKEWRTDFRVVEYVSKPGAPIKTRASFAIEAGRAGANEL